MPDPAPETEQAEPMQPMQTPPDAAPDTQAAPAMQLFPEHAMTKLGFQRVLERLAGLCYTTGGQRAAQALVPLADASTIQHQLQQAAEAQQLLREQGSWPISALPPIEQALHRAAIEDSYLPLDDWLALRTWLQQVKVLQEFLAKHEGQYPALSELTGPVAREPGLLKQINQVIDRHGGIRGDASKELKRIRASIAEQSNQLRSQLNSTMAQARQAGWTEAAELALRNDRLVIPLKAGFKNRIQGFVHDISATGQTVYLEPADALALNNRLRELQIAEDQEVLRVLRKLTEALRPHLDLFRQYIRLVQAADLLQAKARLAEQLDAGMPQLNPKARGLHLEQARHPQLTLEKPAGQVVPLDVHLYPHCRMLLISGPNAGGKSVALQTAGFLQLMVQTGLLPPVGERSEFPVLKRLFIDMGDDQSLDNDLSTYTSHLWHMQAILEQADERAMVLVDELGSGTDPQVGGAIAQAMLEQLVQRGPLTIITTHYSNLKEYAAQEPKVDNAAMEFDRSSLSPTYRLIQGMPGSSFAFEIAQRVGLGPALLARARELAGTTRQANEELLAELQDKQAKLNRLLDRNKQQSEQLQAQRQRQEEARKQQEQERKRILQQAQAEADQLVQDANKQIEATIREIKEAQAEPQRTKAARQRLSEQVQSQKRQAAEASAAAETAAQEAGAANELAPGTRVRYQGASTEGEILAAEGDRYRISLGDITLSARPEDLEPVHEQRGGKNAGAPGRRSTSKTSAAQSPSESARAQQRIDLRGYRVPEAQRELTAFLDNAVMAGLERVEILHGKGQGVLRDSLRRFLRENFPYVQHLEDAPTREGGSGVTICYLG